MKSTLFIIITLFISACNRQPAQGEWIKGESTDQISTIEKHFRGLDMAMVETGYRYSELYWAGYDTNWDYADYQLKKIKLSLDNALERRPKRATSAHYFLNQSIPEMQQAIAKKDSLVFMKNFEKFTFDCNNCHLMEKVPHFMVKTPTVRTSVIQK